MNRAGEEHQRLKEPKEPPAALRMDLEQYAGTLRVRML